MKPNNNNNKRPIAPAIIMLALMAIMFFALNFRGTTSDKPYNIILNDFTTQKVTEFSLNLGSGALKYKLKDSNDTVSVTVPDVGLFINDIEEYLQYVKEYNAAHPDSQIKFTYIRPSNWGSILSSVLPTVLLLVMMAYFFIMMRRQGGGDNRILNFSKAKVKDQSNNHTTFADVAGADEEKEELQEIVDFLKHPSKFNALGGKVPKGVLLVGPPGTGKTLLARAVAGEAKAPFYSISGSDFVEVYVGVGASRVRDLFEKAKKNAPSIIFIDEIDAVGRQRGAGVGGGHDEREQTLNQLLVEMDGFENNSGVIVMAATNRPDVLDNALLRPGRFDRRVYVNYPDAKGREEILKVHARNKPLAPDVDLNVIAKSTIGFTGADLENILNEAALSAAKAGKKSISEKDIEEATTKVMIGPEKRSKVITEEDRRITAYHEAGHGIVTHFVSPETPVHEISIMPRGQAGGYTMSLPETDRSHHTKKGMLAEITNLLGGRVCEQIKLDDISTGASNDLQRATAIARSMVTQYGFSEKLGPVVYGSGHNEIFLGRDWAQNRNYSEEFANSIDEEIKNIVEQCYERAKSVLEEHSNELEKLVEVLLEYEKMDGLTFLKLVDPEAAQKAEEKKRAEAAERAAVKKAAEKKPATDSPENESVPEQNNKE